MSKNRFAAFAAGTLITVASIGLVATPAEADTTRAGCTVLKPAGPKYVGRDSSNRPVVEWVVKGTCSKGRIIRVQQQRWEEDDPKGLGRGDDYLGSHYPDWVISFQNRGGSFVRTYRTLVPQTWDAGGGKEGNEELYQKVRFRVKEGLTTSAWTPWERGGASWIFH
ncbi:hypothetical protein ARGLB_035_00010 [Arthrobacter globiformis NBRC 12137]|jgi:hypothetical protein|uniref:Secreted protein n=1 Tax=Arthrobacter globiformis (strain ATCC 8010 / DSM 20124 / JCM 1332 / NBRC 12137 / NCIMB 8907 / NRRL B-2979 / 168) TaxID=1077972 RepID=H0QJN7_ARTG1|nr:hypothetical protein [Arthrobacter globiformis]GAB13038.1 hypothetical protein ARGLB_035_00010 [Arthrobacter globiformis NBRC 12137]